MKTAAEVLGKLLLLREEELDAEEHRERFLKRCLQRAIVSEFVRENPGLLHNIRSKYYTQGQMAKHLGMGQPSVCKVEGGNTTSVNTKELVDMFTLYAALELIL